MDEPAVGIEPDARFPITRCLNAKGRAQFAALAEDIAQRETLVVHGDVNGQGAAIIAGHLAELFFHRADILERFLRAPKHFELFESQDAFAAAGGVGGGCYQPSRMCIQLLRARLSEGFGGEWPGVAPLLHELGHMLDHFNPHTGRARMRCDGLLPGLHPRDGAVYSPAARAAFVAGKRIELERYRRFVTGEAGPGDTPPIGHPYVFQNDGEFCAGYLEMFLRNPNAMAQMNPALHTGYVELLRWDPRQAWPRDFEFYIAGNRAFYASGQRLPASRCRAPR